MRNCRNFPFIEIVMTNKPLSEKVPSRDKSLLHERLMLRRSWCSFQTMEIFKHSSNRQTGLLTTYKGQRIDYYLITALVKAGSF